MARRRAPTRRWHIGDRCLVPWYTSLPGRRGDLGGWTRAEVVAVRGDRVVIRRWRFESTHPWWELRHAPRHWA